MISVEVPGFGPIRLEHLVLDMNGTLTVEGVLAAGAAERLRALSEQVQVHVLTADTFGTAAGVFAELPVSLTILREPDEAVAKEAFVADRGAERTAAVGNGRSDARMLALACVGIAVVGGEGCATAAATAADVLVRDINEGLDLLLRPARLKATLRS